MKCTDNKRRKRRRRLSKRERRRRALIRLIVRTLTLLCFVLIIFVIFRFITGGKDKAFEYESETYNKSYHKEELFASSLCVVDTESTDTLSDTSDLKAYGLFNIEQSDTVYAYQVLDKLYPASTTKIMTALVAMENASLSDIVTIGKNACSSSFAWDEQTCGLREGDSVSLEALLHGLLLYSGNDAAFAIAEHVAGSEEAFAEMMNTKAKELMATSSNFKNASGLYAVDHYTSAYDLYLIFNACMKHDEFVKIIGSDSYTAEIQRGNSEIVKKKWEPTNFYALGKAKSPEHVKVIGGKTGTLEVAGNCLILMAEDQNTNPYISVVMGADTKELLYKDMTSLLSQISR